MSATVPDLDGRFDENYLYFYGTTQTAERNEGEADLIVRLLEIAPAMEILDLPCAFGRIANRLAARGARVTGLDASPFYLERARQDAARLDVPVEYVAGDMRQLPWTGRFDRIVIWFISFGYFDDATNRQVLAQCRQALRPGSRLLIDHYNLPPLLRRPQPSMGIASQVGNDLLIYSTRYDLFSGRLEAERLVVRDGKVGRHPFSIRCFAYTELRDWLTQAGFARVDGYSREGGPLTLDSSGMIVVAHA
jgi:SAM-dependent methyltransferase